MNLPIFRTLAGYDRSWFRGDVIAGLTVWAVLVPEALAYASIAGVSPVVGLYAAPGGHKGPLRSRAVRMSGGEGAAKPA